MEKVHPGAKGTPNVGYAVGPKGIRTDSRTVVLIHGAGGSKDVWAGQLAGLDNGLNVVALDLPGHGQTPGPPPQSIGEMADFTTEVLEAWNLPRPLVLGGQSMGAAVALELALTRPELVDGLVIIGSGASLPVNPALFDGLAADFEGTVGVVIKWAVDKSAPESVRDACVLGMIDAGVDAVTAGFRACAAFDRRKDVSGLNKPTPGHLRRPRQNDSPGRFGLSAGQNRRRQTGHDPERRPYGHGRTAGTREPGHRRLRLFPVVTRALPPQAVDVGGRHVEIEYGPRGILPGRPSLLFLPGAGGTRLSCRGQTRPLDRHFNTAALEFPGHGLTPGPPLTSVDQMAALAAKALDEINLPRPIILAGYSLGGVVATLTAILHPQLMDGLALISTALALGGPDKLSGLNAESLASLLHGPNADPRMTAQSAEALRAIPPEVWQADIQAAASWNSRHRPDRIDKPAVVICGERDDLTPPKSAADLAALFPSSRLIIIPGAGHMMAAEQFPRSQSGD